MSNSTRGTTCFTESRGRRRVTVFGGNLDGFVSCIPADAYARHRLLEHPISWNMAKNIYIIISLFWSRSRPSARASLYQVSRCTTVATLFFTLRIANVRVDAHLDAVRAQKKISHECVAQTHVRREATFIYKLVKVHTASSLGTKNNEYKPKITRRSSAREDSCDHGARVHRRDCHKCCIMRPRFTRAMERTATRTAHHLHLLFFLQICSIRVGVSGHFLQ